MMERAIAFLRDIGRLDLAALLRFSSYRFVDVDIWHDIVAEALEILSPSVFTEALAGLPEWDQQRIKESVIATCELELKPRPDRLLFTTTKEPAVQEKDTVYPEIVIHRNQMVAVATGKVRIQDVNDYYRARHRRISRALSELGLEHPNTYADLWDWYRRWREDLPNYAARRRFVRDLYQPVLDRLGGSPGPPVPVRDPTGWERVDRALEKAHMRLGGAKHEEDYQTVGLLCREILISLGQAVFDPTTHSAPDGVLPSQSDAGRMIEGFLTSSASGASNETLRKHARASLALAVELQHRRTADFRAAALCLEATSSVANILAILAGRRDVRDEDAV